MLRLAPTAQCNNAYPLLCAARLPVQGADYAKTEKARLEKMLASGSVHASKVEEMAKKTSILGHLLVSGVRGVVSACQLCCVLGRGCMMMWGVVRDIDDTWLLWLPRRVRNKRHSMRSLNQAK